MKNNLKTKPWLTITVIIALVTGIVSIVAGFFIYSNIQEEHKYLAEKELQIINRLQQQNLQSWRQARFAEANSLSNDAILGGTIEQWLNGSAYFTKETLGSYIKSRLELLTEQFSYNVAYLLDINGNALLASGNNMLSSLPNLEQQALRQSLATSETISTEIRTDDMFAYPFFSNIVPIYANDEPVAAIWLVMDIRKSLYPIIRGTFSSNKTTQSLLFMHDKNEIIVLKPNSKDGTLQIKRIPDTNNTTPIEKAVNGMRGIYHGIDHNGHDSIIYSNAIDNSPWLLITKIFESEALSKSKQDLFNITFPIILGMVFIWITTTTIQQTALKGARSKSNDLALEVLRDPLTNLANRRALKQAIHNSWHKSINQNFNISLLLFDVDHFKKYNDRYGHMAGDECLKRVANIAEAIATRKSDLVARYGGEEFILLLPNTSSDQAVVVAERIRLAIYNENIEHIDSLHNLRVTISVGVTTVSPKSPLNTDWEQASKMLIEHADQALYQAKAAGRNCVRSNAI